MMDFGDAFHSLTKGMDEFERAGSKKRKMCSVTDAQSENEIIENLRLRHDFSKEFIRKPVSNKKSPYRPLMSFSQLVSPPYGYPAETPDLLRSLEYTKPMPVQTEVIPIFHEGHHMLVCSPTGSGKTTSYLLPLLNFAATHTKHEVSMDKHLVHPYCIILSTTQELLGQIWAECVRLGQNLYPKNGKIAILRRKHYNLRRKDESKALKRCRELRLPKETKILITTPKRLASLISKTGKDCPVSFNCLKWLVIDECDKMLESNIGGEEHDRALRTFHAQLTVILNGIRGGAAAAGSFPSVALFSATMPSQVVSWASEELSAECSDARGLVKLQIGPGDAAVSTVKQELRYCGSEQGKLLEMRRLLVSGLSYPCLIFTESRQRAAELFKEILLSDKNILASILSSEKSEAQRNATVKAFREGKINILICTDLLGRGIDFKSLMMVVNYDLPPSPTEYIHRVGRTGRAGRLGGRAVTLWTDADLLHMDAILEVMRKSGATVDDDLQRLVSAWKAKKAKQTHARTIGGVVSRRKGERRLAARVALGHKSKKTLDREKHLLRPWNPHRGSITDVPGSKSRELMMSQTSGNTGKPSRKRKHSKTSGGPCLRSPDV
uniref:ATP-dependent RNA helicase n=1 Tax=Mesocestoides corti TaxID=53468 RepID=A0A5K3FBL3_MESCO